MAQFHMKTRANVMQKKREIACKAVESDAEKKQRLWLENQLKAKEYSMRQREKIAGKCETIKEKMKKKTK